MEGKGQMAYQNPEQIARDKIDKLLKKAFAGKLVPQDANDEPASALLAWIRAERAAVAAKKPTSASQRKKA